MKGETILLLNILSFINGATVPRYDTNEPRQAVVICALDETNTVLVAHEHCNKFYKCDHGVPVEYSCFGDLQFDPTTGICDWPYTVDCGNRIISDEDCDSENNNTGNDNGNENVDSDQSNNDNGLSAGNCDPSQAPSICASESSDGILVAHENCNQYYICSHGLPIPNKCSGNLLFNPSKNYCDWPENVDCGVRVIPDPECDDTNTANENSNNDTEDNENGSGNCDPSEAPLICATEGSENVLVAHENCNQYYICSQGHPIPLNCPDNLLFNPVKNYCDWPENVNCGERTIPDSENDNNQNKNENNQDENTIGCGCHHNPSEAPDICAAEGSDGTLVAHESCSKFYLCNHGTPVAIFCSTGLFYNPSTEQCDWPENVDCGDRLIPQPDSADNGNAGDSNDSGTEDNDNKNDNELGNNENIGVGCGCHDNPSEAVEICAAEGSNGILVAHESCNKFYLCNHGTPVTISCSTGLLYNPSTEQCDWPENVDCGDRLIPQPDSADNGNAGDSNDSGTKDNDNIESENDQGDNENNGVGCGCHHNPNEAPEICAAEGSDGILVAHESCSEFYLCNHGTPVAISCSTGLLYNPSTEQCDWPENVDCGDRFIPKPDSTDNGNAGDSNDNGAEDNDNIESEKDQSDNENNGVGCGCHHNPTEAPEICAADGSDGILVAHESCNKFYLCNHGTPVTISCSTGLLYNPSTEQCDWPENVDCGDRLIPQPDSTDNDNAGDSNDNGAEDNDNIESENDQSDNENNGVGCGCHHNPNEAPEICAADGSDGILVAHESCNKFFLCNHGTPVTISCSTGLLYNPSTEQCDWPENVDCGDRLIPQPDSTDNGNAGDSNDNGAEDNDNIESETDQSDNENNGVGCGCHHNPNEAPEICAADGSDGILVAHESCNKFYLCNHGTPVTISCSIGLLYNPSTEQCDWPENVDCGDRLIPQPDSTDNGNAGDSNDNGATEDNDNIESENDQGDNENNGVGCGCHHNPNEAPEICAAEGSDGILVAHESCSKFYLCNHGTPVAISCSTGLLYNPSTEQCDWPENVDCGDRLIPKPDSTDNGNAGDSNDNGAEDNDNIESENDQSDNENNGVGCGCHHNPNEAPQICAAKGSDGILVAHESCNKFYLCNHGTPVTISCSTGLLYNPSTEQCDWPENVDCGDRLIPQPDSTDNGNAGDSNDNGAEDNDNTESENDQSDNENNGVGCGCHHNPNEAPKICAAEGSDGILVAHESCNKFYLCNHGTPVTISCSTGLLYNPSTEQCDWPENVDCGDRLIPQPDSTDNGNAGDSNDHGAEDNDNIESENDQGDNENNGVGCGCHHNPNEAPEICAAEGSDGILVAHESCSKFYLCNHGTPVAISCSTGLLYNPSTEQCDWPENVDCGDRFIPKPDSTDNGNAGDSNDNGAEDNDNIESENDQSDNENNGVGCGCHHNPTEAPEICAADGSDGILVAHESCNKFYLCNHGTPVTISCSTGLLYNPSTEQCDWPENVDCGDRLIPQPDSTDNDNAGDSNDNGAEDNDNIESENDQSDNENNGVGCGCHHNPNEAPEICAADGSDGILVAHESCNKFFLCNHGTPVTISCSTGLLYNPSTEQCDWPENVDCGDRLIPQPDSTDNGNAGDSNDNGAEDNDNIESETDQSDNENNGVGCGCHHNPSEAPQICAAERSDGILVAHESCNKFFLCNHGTPVPISCSNGLLYNPSTEQCDWPENVDCGDRFIPQPDCADSGNAGDSNDNGAKDKDNIENENDQGDNENTGVGCGCHHNPSEAPEICAAKGSDGILVAHESCNKFYLCSHGTPVTISCSAGLLYNPKTEQCDWPEHVDCGNRDNSSTDCDGNDNSDDSNDNAQGSDNQGNGDGCSCNDNPAEAPAICATEGSDGVLVAHDNCNQFYVCNNGSPVVLDCPTELLYDPVTERCDWAENINCGNRTKPDSSDQADCDDAEVENSPDNDDNDENTNENDKETEVKDDFYAEEARRMCSLSDSEGKYYPHLNCNQFQVCVGGVPNVLTCPASTLYDVASHNCLWADSVNCEDRII